MHSFAMIARVIILLAGLGSAIVVVGFAPKSAFVPPPIKWSDEGGCAASSFPVPESSNLRLSMKRETEEFEEYARCLTPRAQRKQVDSESSQYSVIDQRPAWQRAALAPLRLGRKLLPQKAKPKPGALILIRCGESTWNLNQTFTGWADPDLTADGQRECEHAARLLVAQGYQPDVVYTSRLKRAVCSVWSILTEMDSHFLPVYKSWRLNERFYGALTGLSKKEAAKELGADVVQAWRNSLNARPPPIKITDAYYPGNDPRYSDVPKEDIPFTESLLDCQERARPLWEYKIKNDVENGENVLVVAHTNTLRGLIKVIDGIGDDDIQHVSMPTAIPFVYRFDKEMNPVQPKEGSLTQVHTSGIFLEKPGLLKEALKRQEDWDRLVPGLNATAADVDSRPRRVSTLEESLLRLKAEHEIEKLVGESIPTMDIDSGADGNMGAGIKLVDGYRPPFDPFGQSENKRWEDDPSEFEEYFATSSDEFDVPMTVMPLPDEGIKEDKEDAVVVLIRHGRTAHNNLGLFTGWEDAPLAEEGVEDAKNAGRLLKRHGFKFDVVYTSWLTRAIETAWYCMGEMDMHWLPMVKSWRLVSLFLTLRLEMLAITLNSSRSHGICGNKSFTLTLFSLTFLSRTKECMVRSPAKVRPW